MFGEHTHNIEHRTDIISVGRVEGWINDCNKRNEMREKKIQLLREKQGWIFPFAWKVYKLWSCRERKNHRMENEERNFCYWKQIPHLVMHAVECFSVARDKNIGENQVWWKKKENPIPAILNPFSLHSQISHWLWKLQFLHASHFRIAQLYAISQIIVYIFKVFLYVTELLWQRLCFFMLPLYVRSFLTHW